MEVIVTAQVSLLPAATAPCKVSMVFLITITRSAGLGSCMKLEVYHWWELPQVWLLSQQMFCCDKHVFVMTSMIFVATKLVVTSICLSWQTHVCHDKNVLCCNKIMLVATKLLSWQTYFCCNRTFVMTNKGMLVTTKLLSRQTHVCHDKYLLRHKYFVVTNIILSQQNFCHDKHTFVTTKDVFWVWAHSQCTGRYLFWNGCMDTMGAVTPVTYSVCVLRQSAGIGKSRNLRCAPACILSYWEPFCFVRIHPSGLFEANSFKPTNLMHNISQPL